MLGIFPGV